MRGEFGWTGGEDDTVKITQYLADAGGYHTQHFIITLLLENQKQPEHDLSGKYL